MAYTPLNRIQTNLYTTGGEYQSLNGYEYAGYYHKYYDGRIFSGRSPQQEDKIRLIEIKKESLGEFKQSTLNIVAIASFVNDPDPPLDQTTTPTVPNIRGYFVDTKKDPRDLTKVRLAPSLYFPKPTQEEYQIQEFTRFFCKKINENLYVEITEDFYLRLESKDPGVMFELYIPIKLPWRIAGDMQEVATVNKNLTLLTQQQLKITGLQQYLKEDYLKFYKES